MLIIYGLVELAAGTCTPASTQSAHPIAETQWICIKGQILQTKLKLIFERDLNGSMRNRFDVSLLD